MHRHSVKDRICVLFLNIVIIGKLILFGLLQAVLHLDNLANITLDTYEDTYSDESFTIKTTGCVIPAIKIQDESIMKFLNERKNRRKICNNYSERLIISNQTHIWILKENYKHYNINNESNFVCCYKSFHRPLSSRNISYNMVDYRIQYLDCMLFTNSIEVKNEFVKVACYYEHKNIYNQYFTFAPKKQFTFNREKPHKSTSKRSIYNIIIMGIGSMSRQNFHRTMPNTLELLKTHEAIELQGYSTVAEDTFQNMIPVLVGMSSSELKHTCWTRAWPTLDSCPFIWERFKDVGYYTAFVEDTSRFGMFNKGTFGFRGSPTDYYLHPFIHESETLDKESNDKQRKHNKQNETKDLSYCMGDTYYFEVLLNYVERITTTLKKSKLFGFFWETTMSHDSINDPINMDTAYAKLINNMESTGYLNNTILIFLSDHGMGIGDIHLTRQGQIEQRFPFISILMPPSFRNNYILAYRNLMINAGRLTTPFDLHKTLIDLIDMTSISGKQLLKRSTEFYSRNRGISLFLQIPKNRTCEMAGIKDTWCTCYNDIKLPLNSPILLDAVRFLNIQANEILRPYPNCLKLIIDEIIAAKEMVPVYDKKYKWRDFGIIVRMAPGGGIFRTIVRYYNKTWTIVDHMKALNLPVFRNLCVENSDIKLFCYCK